MGVLLMHDTNEQLVVNVCDTLELGHGGLVDCATDGDICLVAEGALTLCGITFIGRGFSRRGGTSGAGVNHTPCSTCRIVAFNRGLAPRGIHAHLFEAPEHTGMSQHG